MENKTFQNTQTKRNMHRKQNSECSDLGEQISTLLINHSCLLFTFRVNSSAPFWGYNELEHMGIVVKALIRNNSRAETGPTTSTNDKDFEMRSKTYLYNFWVSKLS